MNKSFNIHDARFDRQISSSDRPFPIDRYSMVSLQYLDSIADPEAHCPIYTGMLAMIINIRSSKDYKTKSKVYSRGKTSSSEEEEKSYDKMISLMCFGSQPGQNACIVLAKGGATDRLFESNVARRDSPNHNGFGPGAWVFLKKPEVITAHFGDPEKGIPVLQFEPPFLLVDKVVTPFTPEPVPVRRITSKLACFFLTKCHIEIRNFSIVYVKCKGEFCDAVDILSGNPNHPHRSCACFAMHYHKGTLLYKMELWITPDPVAHDHGEPFKAHFMSRKTTKVLTGGGIPKNTDLSQVSAGSLDDEMFEWAKRFFLAGNQLGGFNVAGWYRVGTIKDQGSSSENAVASSNLIHHITVLDFPGGWNRLRALECPVTTLINDRVAPPPPNVEDVVEAAKRAAEQAAANAAAAAALGSGAAAAAPGNGAAAAAAAGRNAEEAGEHNI